MRLNLPTSFWPLGAGERRAVVVDAEALIRDFGPAALEIAEARSSREDLGLLPTRRPGHWSRVAHAIGRRPAGTVDQPVAERAA